MVFFINTLAFSVGREHTSTLINFFTSKLIITKMNISIKKKNQNNFGCFRLFLKDLYNGNLNTL